MFDKINNRQQIKESLEKSSLQTQKTNEMIEESRKIQERFYNQVVILSGGTIALSVTFLGYLKNFPNIPVKDIYFLFISWGFLLISLLGALYRNHHYMRYLFYSGIREYMKVNKESKKKYLMEF